MKNGSQNESKSMPKSWNGDFGQPRWREMLIQNVFLACFENVEIYPFLKLPTIQSKSPKFGPGGSKRQLALTNLLPRGGSPTSSFSGA